MDDSVHTPVEWTLADGYVNVESKYCDATTIRLQDGTEKELTAGVKFRGKASGKRRTRPFDSIAEALVAREHLIRERELQHVQAVKQCKDGEKRRASAPAAAGSFGAGFDAGFGAAAAARAPLTGGKQAHGSIMHELLPHQGSLVTPADDERSPGDFSFPAVKHINLLPLGFGSPVKIDDFTGRSSSNIKAAAALAAPGATEAGVGSLMQGFPGLNIHDTPSTGAPGAASTPIKPPSAAQAERTIARYRAYHARAMAAQAAAAGRQQEQQGPTDKKPAIGSPAATPARARSGATSSSDKRPTAAASAPASARSTGTKKTKAAGVRRAPAAKAAGTPLAPRQLNAALAAGRSSGSVAPFTQEPWRY